MQDEYCGQTEENETTRSAAAFFASRSKKKKERKCTDTMVVAIEDSDVHYNTLFGLFQFS